MTRWIVWLWTDPVGQWIAAAAMLAGFGRVMLALARQDRRYKSLHGEDDPEDMAW
jgi:hypothetical protein